MEHFWDHISHMADVAIVVGPIFIWLVKWLRRIEATFGLTKSFATVHLPFVYKRLEEHDHELGIIPVQHPDIGLIPNGNTMR